MLHQIEMPDSRNGLRILVVGCGGTGSHLIPLLAKYNYHLISKEQEGFSLTAMDDDIIEHKNIGRQNFSPFQVGMPKVTTIIESVNRFYGFSWKGITDRFNMLTQTNYHIIISCVDSAQSRISIGRSITGNNNYWIDAGNGFDFGQIIVGRRETGTQPRLPNVLEEFPDITRHEQMNTGMGCNDERQGLFVNTGMAYYTAYIVKRMIDDKYLDFRGIYLSFGNDINVNLLR